MGISRRSFIKGLGGGLTALSLGEVIFSRQGWANVPAAKTRGATKTTSIYPFYGVGCGLAAYTANGRLVAVEGDPEHPINRGTLCSKGQAVFEVVTSPRRLKNVLYRAPGSDAWEEKPLDWAVKTVAQRLKDTRDASFTAKTPAGVTVNRTEALASIGGAALNNEECYLITKLARALGIVYLEHQARL